MTNPIQPGLKLNDLIARVFHDYVLIGRYLGHHDIKGHSVPVIEPLRRRYRDRNKYMPMDEDRKHAFHMGAYE